MTTVTYDSTGRMKYHPDYHPNHGKPYTTQDFRIYARCTRDMGIASGCRWHWVGRKPALRVLSTISGNPESSISSKTYNREGNIHE